MRLKTSLVGLIFLLAACTGYPPPVTQPGVTDTPVSPPTVTPTSPPIPAPVVSGPGIVSLRMFDELQGWAIAEEAILRTDTGGQVWHDVSPAGMTAFGFSAHGFFRNPQQAWVLTPDAGDPGGGGRLYRTTDGGLTWASISVPFRDGHVAFVDDRNGWATVDLGAGAGSMAVAVLKTSDGGLTWEQVFTNDPNLEGSSDSLPLGGIKMSFTPLDSQTAWIGGVIYAPGTFYFYRTTDGGKTWEQQALPPAPGSDTGEIAISQGPTFFSPTEAVLPVRIAGENIQTAFYKTKDGGESWEFISIQPGAGTVDFISPDEGIFWSGDQFFATFDGGATWFGVQPDILFGDSFIGMEFVDAHNGWVWTYEPTGARYLYATTDSGETWISIGQ